MQITPEAAKEIERHSGGTTFKLQDLSDPEINIRYGTYLLHELLDRYDGDEIAALAAYNAGPANVDKWGGADPDRRARSRSPKPAPTSKRCSTSSAPTATSTRRSWATEPRGPATARCRAGARRRPGAGRLLDRRPRPAADLPRARHQRRRRHLGARLLQPGDGAGGRPCRPPRAPGRPGPGRSGRAWRSSPARGSPARLSTTLSTLIAARCVQALGGAAAVTAVLELLPATVGSERRATALWATAGCDRRRAGPGGRAAS